MALGDLCAPPHHDSDDWCRSPANGRGNWKFYWAVVADLHQQCTHIQIAGICGLMDRPTWYLSKHILHVLQECSMCCCCLMSMNFRGSYTGWMANIRTLIYMSFGDRAAFLSCHTLSLSGRCPHLSNRGGGLMHQPASSLKVHGTFFPLPYERQPRRRRRRNDDGYKCCETPTVPRRRWSATQSERLW